MAAVNKHTESLRLEAEMMGKSTFETDRARATLSLLTAAKKEGLDITPQLRAQIEQEAEAYGRASEQLERTAENQQRVNQLQQELGNIAGGAISGLIDGTESWGDSLANVTKRMADLVLQAALLGDGHLRWHVRHRGVGRQCGRANRLPVLGDAEVRRRRCRPPAFHLRRGRARGGGAAP
ncbi:MAG: hypothetical protein B7Z41_06535 [Rhizobiales bacterium 12-66-7]|nr:MAG: hypothetical protein B7Z41_06535 [Rhizobiales bacterium 12-66-7]